jgi:hypothetical protein
MLSVILPRSSPPNPVQVLCPLPCPLSLPSVSPEVLLAVLACIISAVLRAHERPTPEEEAEGVESTLPKCFRTVTSTERRST